jgi:hypothetical protein
MSDASVFKEFLVSLGFRVEESSFKKFETGIKVATKVAGELGAASVAAAAAVEAAVVKISAKFEDLYYASQRIHSSVENIRAMDYAVTQMGGSAQGARAAMEGIAEFMRSNPGGERFIGGLGVATRDANGELRDTADIVKDLGARFREMPYFAAKVRAGMLGIDERTLQALIRGTDDFSDRYHAMAQRIGVDQQAAAKASHDFMVRVRDLRVELELLFDKAVLALQGPSGQALTKFAERAGIAFTALGHIVERLGEWFGKLDDATDGGAGTLTVLLGILGAVLLVIDPVVVGVVALGLAIAALIDDFQTWREGGKSLLNWEGWKTEINGAIGAIKLLVGAIGDLVAALTPLNDRLHEVFGPGAQKDADRAWNAWHIFFQGAIGDVIALGEAIKAIAALLRGDWRSAWDHAKAAGSALAAPAAAAQQMAAQNPGRPSAQAAPAARAPAAANRPAARGAAAIGDRVAAYLQANGFTREQAQGMAAGAYAESLHDPGAVNPTSGAFGVGQWLGERKAQLFKRYGRHPTLNQQLEFMVWELTHTEGAAADSIRGSGSARGALRAYVQNFMRPGPGTAGDLARGAQYLAAQTGRPVLATGGAAAAVTITQKTDIHVQGGSDAAATGRAVANEQGRVNGNLVRHTKGALS